jgi:hypothetical protein
MPADARERARERGGGKRGQGWTGPSASETETETACARATAAARPRADDARWSDDATRPDARVVAIKPPRAASENNPLGYRRRDDGERARTGSAAEDPRAKADAFPVLTTTGARSVAKADIVWWREAVDACVEVTSISGVSGHVSSAVFRINKVRSFDSD